MIFKQECSLYIAKITQDEKNLDKELVMIRAGCRP